MADPGITDGFDQGDDDVVLSVLKKWKGGRLSNSLFTFLSKMIPITCFETVVLRKKEKSVEVLLIPRPDDDPVWKGKLHSPGASIRHADYLREDGDPFGGVFERIEDKEIGSKFSERPKLITTYPCMTDRGPEIVHVYLARVDDNVKLPPGSGWYDVKTLESIPNIIRHQLKAIRLASEEYE